MDEGKIRVYSCLKPEEQKYYRRRLGSRGSQSCGSDREL